jgi:hypothetical protein
MRLFLKLSLSLLARSSTSRDGVIRVAHTRSRVAGIGGRVDGRQFWKEMILLQIAIDFHLQLQFGHNTLTLISCIMPPF